MDRRKFLKSCAVGGVACAVPVSLLPSVSEPVITSIPAVIGEYSDYVNFSDMLVASCVPVIDLETTWLAQRLAASYAREVDRIVVEGHL